MKLCKRFGFAFAEKDNPVTAGSLYIVIHPQQLAVFVKLCELIKTHTGASPARIPAFTTSFSRISEPFLSSPTSKATHPSGLKIRLNSLKTSVIRCTHRSRDLICQMLERSTSTSQIHMRSQLSPT